MLQVKLDKIKVDRLCQSLWSSAPVMSYFLAVDMVCPHITTGAYRHCH